MELIIINDKKLKLMLSDEDMAKYQLDGKLLSLNDDSVPDGEVCSMFKSILKDAGEQMGFKTDSERMLIQLYPCKDGGCEIYITKLGASKKSNKKAKAEQAGFGDLATTCFLRGGTAYSFDCLDDILSACRLLFYRCNRLDGSAYRGEDGRYLLCFDGGESAKEKMILGEFGKREPADKISLYISEHFSVIKLFDAVSVLSEL